MNLLQFDLLPTKAIHNFFSSGGKSTADRFSASVYPGDSSPFTVLSGALTANVPKKILSVAGAGIIHSLFLYTLNTSSRILGLKLVIDGVTVFDALSDAIASLGKGLVCVGQSFTDSAGFVGVMPVNIIFSAGFDVWVSSSLSETDMIVALLNYSTVN